jgi:PAS domain S-box-containing protein
MNADEARTLELEIAALRERLAEAEDVRRAISQGEVDAFVVGARDEDKKVLLLAGAYSRYRQLLDETEHGTVTVGAEGEILFANRRFARIVGAALGELYRAGLADYVHPEDRAAVAALLTTPHAAGEEGLPARFVQPGGAQVQVKVSLASTWESYSTLVVSDLTHEQAEAEARQTLEAIRRGEVDAFVMGETVVTLNGARDPYQVLADRIQQGALTLSAQRRIVYANSRLVRMLGVPAERLLGTSFESYVIAPDRGLLAAALAPRGENGHGNGTQAEVRLRRASGEWLQALVSVAALADGQSMCLVTDLTESKRHAAADERTRKFLGMLAHEFRNMLNGMRLSVELLKREEQAAERGKAIDSLERQMHRMLQVVEDLRSINPRD